MSIDITNGLKFCGETISRSSREVNEKIELHAKIISESSELLSKRLEELTNAIEEQTKASNRTSKIMIYLTLVIAFASILSACSNFFKPILERYL